MTGPKLSFTVPVTVNACALVCVTKKTKSNTVLNALKKISFFFINIGLID